ncbi:MAG: nickel pincer cofactor biosynthesis protein LarC [Solobacterium sp.]|nr:nickel pincer cofactor biosynthesis protein LarC [Solobacterium sp.]
MKTIYIECNMGAAGDMLTAALLEVQDDPQKALNELNALGIPGVEYVAESAEKCGIRGTHMRVFVHGQEEGEHLHEEEHHHHHDHEHGHTHHHAGLKDIHANIESLQLSDTVRNNVIKVYDLLAEAESHVHGTTVEEIHFHEVGTMDAVADITAVCYLLDRLGVERVLVSPVHVGSGTVKCAHGILPVPAPATAYLCRDVPVYSTEIRGELCTPTGMALLKTFAYSFGPMPVMRIAGTGYGMGTKDFPVANCVRVFLGETEEQGDKVIELDFNVDDMTGEEIGFATERLLEGGAREVFTTPVYMKKNRPGILFSVLCTEDTKKDMVSLIFKHTTTLGIRETKKDRYTMERHIEREQTPYGEVRRKISSGYGQQKEKQEFEDLARIAKTENLSLFDTRKLTKKTEE